MSNSNILKEMDYLTVDRRKYLQPSLIHRRCSRSVSPRYNNASYVDDDLAEGICINVPEVKKRRKSLFSLHKTSSSDSSANSSLKSHKTSNSMVCGLANRKHHRRAQVTEVYRPRCYTDPGLKQQQQQVLEQYHLATPVLIVPEPVSSAASSANVTPQIQRKHYPLNFETNALGSLIKQTIQVTTASVGLKPSTSEDRLTQFSNKPLNKDVKKRFSRSTSSVSTLSYTAADINSMAPLHSHAEAQSDTCLNTLDRDAIDGNPAKQQNQSEQKLKLLKHQYYQQLSLPESVEIDYSTAVNSISSVQNLFTLANSNKNETRSLRNTTNSLNPLVTVSSTASIRSGSSSSSATKNEQNYTASTAQSGNAAATTATATTEKEKKRKEVSSSRVKKFHRHFMQVPKDEKLINYFSCALVSDILLQGHLYITEQHFAFYSNVFGYVTKVVIPTSSVTKISKEKTAKIIPNAVGVATAEERHVFGSFISREAAFQLMCSVCPPMAPAGILPKAPADNEICEEYSIEDDSSCSISGNESPPQQQLANGTIINAIATPDGAANNIDQTILGRPFDANLNIGDSKNDKKNSSANSTEGAHSLHKSSLLGLNQFDVISPTSSATSMEGTTLRQRLTASIAASTSSASSSSPTTIVSTPTAKYGDGSKATLLRAFFPNISAMRMPSLPSELHLIYLGVMLAVLLCLFSVFLLYRVLDIEAKANMYSSPPINFNIRSGNDDDIFNEALRWQKELQSKSNEEAQDILTKNLEQIAKVRRSLETLSMLIHDRSSVLDPATHTDANRD